MKTYGNIIIIVIVAYFLIVIFANHLCNWQEFEERRLDSQISVEITRKDGSVERHNSHSFPMLNRGDVAIISIHIPDSYQMESPTLCFHFFNCVTTIDYEGEVYYSYGTEHAQKGKQIGTVYGFAELPEDIFGKTITMKCVAMENQAMNRLEEVTLMPAVESAKVFYVNSLADFIVFFSVMFIALIAALTMLVVGVKIKEIRLLMWITWFIFELCMYIMANQGVFVGLTYGNDFSSNVEYITLFSAPIPLAAYFFEMYKTKWLKLFSAGILTMFVLIFVVCTILNYTTVNYHYCEFLAVYLWTVIISLTIYTVLAIALGRKNSENSDSKWMVPIHIGLALLMSSALIEIIRFILKQYNVEAKVESFEYSVLPCGMLAAVLALLFGSYQYLLYVQEENREKERLEQLVYLDVLTGLQNRMKCFDYMEQMKQEEKKDYCLFYLDLNDLKTVNDQYGHDAGDEYLKAAVTAMRKSFLRPDVMSRIGGDEFVVIYDSQPPVSPKKLVNRFRAEMSRINHIKAVEFHASVACGYVVSTQNEPLSPEEAMAMADQAMYEDKKKQKEQRN